ncbi:18621_t:CDS:2 [Gigaspora margarita]|uniref:18621_t:CDS:1 n=1 Tax=Gigaspora margarita TaxID=4874 RepID=A0ABN7UMD5_GIGMA|nr:18621_t:CDS:2 [Gigaspora margarita]
MELRKSVLIGIGVLSVIDTTTKNSEINGVNNFSQCYSTMASVIMKNAKRGKKKAAKRRRAEVEIAKNRITTFVKKAVDEVSKESFPTDDAAKEKYFMDQVSNGETLLAEGKERHLDAALCFYKALKVYPNPVELIMIYQKTIPEAVINVIYEMMKAGHFDYGIEEQLEKKTSSEQMVVDVETTKVNLHKALMELNIYGNQNKKNDIVNLALMKIDPNKVSDESNIEINPIQEDEIIVPAKQILANQPILPRIVTGSNAIKIINKRSFSSSGDNRDINSQKVISGRTRRESLKEQDREAPRVRFKAIKMSKENPYINNGSMVKQE